MVAIKCHMDKNVYKCKILMQIVKAGYSTQGSP
jgi:hypothetical protein